MSRCILHPVHLAREIRRMLSKKCNFLVRIGIKIKIKWETWYCTSYLFSFVYGPASTYLCIISHQCYASESNFKLNIGIQNIWIHQQDSNFVTSLLLTYASSFNMWDKMASLQWWFHQQRADWSAISEWLTFQKCEFQPNIAQSFLDEAFNKEYIF